jgi:diguanylate cyclase (GGDEF)-like protein/PAS domain S-box-containing protein
VTEKPTYADLEQKIEKPGEKRTRSRHTEEALAESEANLREAQSIARLGRWELNLINDRLEWSDTIFEIFEIDPKKFGASYEAFLAAIHPDDREAVDRAYTESFQNRTPYEISHRLLMKDGRIKWVNEICRTDYDSSGKAVRSVGVVQDITERKRTEERLYRTQFATDRAPDSILWVGGEGDLEYANDAACSSLGYTREEMLQMKVFDIDPDFPPEGWEQHKKDLKRLGRMTFESHHRTKDGRLFPVEVTTNYLKYNGRFFAIAFDRDITERKQVETALRESKAQLDLALESARMGTWILDLADGRRCLDDRTCDLLGIDAVTFRGTEEEFFGIMHPDDRQAVKELLARAIDQNVPYEPEYRVILPDGRVRFIGARGMVIRDAGGRPLRLNGVAWDITNRKEMENALQESERKFRDLSEKSVVGIYLIQDNVLRYVNTEFSRIFGYPVEDIIDKLTLKDVVFPDDLPLVEENIRKKISGTVQSANYGFRIYTGNREIKHVEVFSSITTYQGRSAVIGSLLDVSERNRMEERLRESEKKYRELSIIDDLTRLYNSRHLYAQLKAEIERASRYEEAISLILLDVDNFKTFNDTYGHIEGDQVLVRLAQVIQRCLRKTDSAYRYGGEEFTVLLPMTTRDNGAVIAERIRTEFKKENFSPVPGNAVHMTVSMGVAQYKPGEDMKTFIHRADQSMYQAKKQGKDRVYPAA